jgi:hypothetical protein
MAFAMGAMKNPGTPSDRPRAHAREPQAPDPGLAPGGGNSTEDGGAKAPPQTN